MLKSRFEHEVDRINVYQDRFLVANTEHTLMLGDMETCRLSEVSWETTGTEKYHFDNPQVCHEELLCNLPAVNAWAPANQVAGRTCQSEIAPAT